ncbi:FadR/GntR family transcriptional regulator [Kitasatospora sp. HPMI-4]|uniref:FadR/GntR family transcriptional regulator n=1 Tax=Kitasatospora sp. HPMI-4 TaxID=3448443 RepID=UPI003F1C8A27
MSGHPNPGARKAIPTAVTDLAIEKIKNMIVSGRLAPGSRLPNESVLAEQLGLSRSSLREAVRALTAMHILVPKQGAGTYVSSLEPHLLMETMAFASDVSDGESARQLLHVRRLLEPQATALAAGQLTSDQLADLGRILECSMGDISVERFVELDIEFHRIIVDSVGNPVLSTLLGILSTHTQRLRIVRGTRDAPARARTCREHQAILGALAARDAQLAASAAAVHVAAVEEWLDRSTSTASPATPPLP